jgi:hypothetical protein
MKNLVVGSIVLVLVTLGWSASGMGEQALAPRGETARCRSTPDELCVDCV